jgi:hypothetical protein
MQRRGGQSCGRPFRAKPGTTCDTGITPFEDQWAPVGRVVCMSQLVYSKAKAVPVNELDARGHRERCKGIFI